MDISEVVKVLDETCYRVRVRQSGDGVVLTVPPNLSVGARDRDFVQAIRVVRGDVQGLGCRVGDEDESFVPLPEYAARCILEGLVVQACEAVEFPSSLVEYAYEDGSPAERLSDVVADPMDVGRERLLEGLLDDGLSGGFTPALDERAYALGVGLAFETCKNFFGEAS